MAGADAVCPVVGAGCGRARGQLRRTGRARLAGTCRAGQFGPSRVNDVALARHRTCSPEQLLELLTAHLQPRGLPAALGGRVALVEGASITRTSAAVPGLSRPRLYTGPGLVAEYAALGEAMRAAGVFIDSGQLSPVSAAKLVRVTAGQSDVSDGPAPGGGQAPST